MPWIEITIVVLFLVPAVFLMKGRGASLIAGYNTMSKKEKEKYDGPALCRFAGKMMLVMTAGIIMIMTEGYFPGKHLYVYGNILLIGAILFTVIYANTGGRFRRGEKK